MNTKQWKVNKKAPKSFLNKFPEYSNIVLQLLWDRGLKTQKKIDEFFNPDYDQDLHDPFLLKDIKKAITRIEKAGKNKEKVAVFADYDADGVCSATIIKEVLGILKIKPEIYIPDRNLEGYGLNIDAVEELSKRNIGLIITVDCGVTDFEEIELANKKRIDTIIIDHHEIPPKLPRAHAIINPKQKNCKYPFDSLSAGGVAFKFAQAVARVKKIGNSWEKWLLDLVAISTVADSMILLGENRTLVKYGLIVLSQTKRIGLRALMEKARIKPDYNSESLKTNLTAYTLGFVIAPRLNAASRMEHGTIAYNLLNVSREEKAKQIAEQLERKNQERQREVEKIINEARERIKKYSKNKKVIIEGDEKWNPGIAGLVAQRIKEEFWMPCFIYQKKEGVGVGSARSIDGFNIIKVLSKCRKFLEEMGGHTAAAGFKFLESNFDKFYQTLEKASEQELKNKKLKPQLNIDSEVQPREIGWQLLDDIQKLSPFGKGNCVPLFLVRKLEVISIRKVGSNGGHLKIFLEGQGKNFSGIGFNLGDFCDKIRIGSKIDIVFELIANEWNGNRELQLKIVDIKKNQ